MNLIDIVKKLDWPDGANIAVQDRDGQIKWSEHRIHNNFLFGVGENLPDRDGDWWVHDGSLQGCSTQSEFRTLWAMKKSWELASDWGTTIITKKDWEQAQSLGEQK